MKREFRRDPEAMFTTPLGTAAWMYYAAGVRAAQAFADVGFPPARHVGIPVVSIGALTFGGAGKTPIARWIAQGLAARGEKVAILSRGYKGEGGRASRFVDAGRPDAARDGDEPALLASTCSKAIVVVGADRTASAELAAGRGATIAILDDGHQHRRLARQLNIVLWDEASARALVRRPRGLGLREPISGLARADVLLRIDRGGGAPETPPFLPSGTIVAALRLVSRRVAGTAAASVHALSGIADPASFERSLAASGVDVRGASRFPDHHAFRDEEIAAAVAAARTEGVEAVAITAKDRVRGGTLFDACEFPIVVYDLDVETSDEALVFDAILNARERKTR